MTPLHETKPTDLFEPLPESRRAGCATTTEESIRAEIKRIQKLREAADAQFRPAVTKSNTVFR